MSWIIAGSQPFNGLARNGRSLRFTPRKIRRTRITRLKPCACSPPYVHKFNININTGDGGRRSISTGFALEILRSLHPSNHEIKDFGFVGGFSSATQFRLQQLQFIKIILETVGVSWIIAGSQPSTGLLAMGVRFAPRPAKSARLRSLSAVVPTNS